MSEHFRVGGKVVAINYPASKKDLEDVAYWKARGCSLIYLKPGDVFTVRAIRMEREGTLGLAFSEITNMRFGDVEGFYDSRWFRPLLEKKTDISMLEKLLKTKHLKELIPDVS